jgi:hypothetical protein
MSEHCPVTSVQFGTKSSLHRLAFNWPTSNLVSVKRYQLGLTENTAPLLLLKLFPWERVLFVKVLRSDGSGIFFLRSMPSNGSTSYSILHETAETWYFFIIVKKLWIQKRPRQCPSGPLQHSPLNILVYYYRWQIHLPAELVLPAQKHLHYMISFNRQTEIYLIIYSNKHEESKIISLGTGILLI